MGGRQREHRERGGSGVRLLEGKVRGEEGMNWSLDFHKCG